MNRKLPCLCLPHWLCLPHILGTPPTVGAIPCGCPVYGFNDSMKIIGHDDEFNQGTHKGHPYGGYLFIIFIILPFQGIGLYVFRYLIIGFFITDDVFVIIALP